MYTIYIIIYIILYAYIDIWHTWSVWDRCFPSQEMVVGSDSQCVNLDAELITMDVH